MDRGLPQETGKIASVPAGDRTKPLPNTYLERYRYVDPPDEISVVTTGEIKRHPLLWAEVFWVDKRKAVQLPAFIPIFS
jgi:hypothetical protein